MRRSPIRRQRGGATLSLEIHEGGAEMMTILCAVDGSESAESALEFAIRLCEDSGATLHVIAVKPPVLARGAGPSALRAIDDEGGIAEIAEHAVLRAMLDGVEATPVLACGPVAEEIARAAVRLDADLVVVGSRGHGALTSAVMGSVSRALLRCCEVPVAVIAHRRVREPEPIGAAER
jgi:nucleotide-binding universal stress UspA family protein